MRLLVAFCLLLFTLNAPANAWQSLNGIAAIVNNDIITTDALKRAMRVAKAPGVAQAKNVQHQVLEQLIDEKLEMQVAKKAGINITGKQVKQTIAGIAKRNNMTVSALEAAVAEEGLSASAYHKKIRKQLLISQLQKKVIGHEINVDKKEVDALLAKHGRTQQTQYNLGDILIAPPENATAKQVADAKVKAQNIVKALKKGQSFTTLAISESANSDTFDGGEMGWRALAELPDLFAKPVQHMAVESIKGPIRAANGFHIIKLLGKRQKMMQGSLTRAQAQQQVFAKKAETALKKWLKTLRANSYIKILPHS